ncbi:Cytochrome b5 like Heme Steroid binding domain [Trypanosoma vivax]|uniref:Putative cytochrome b-domain protein n=1 Tax=Trypanosoma vivax (strain Y486) TaxID=1055687 RepID=G0TT18_TRYVY|nr:putative cytochrome b-domain protein [Trypanosoma vivax]KAH8619770.1 Cytochrome b5 like Heme Steroid binding domain [Trypanosoma vivax]CCC47099.1 putative cytochrome b-domain protein [Trypanosoma vivax Y486]
MLDSILSFFGLAKKWPEFSLDDVRQHNNRSSLWIVAGNSIYDATSILDSHPGGASALLRRGGGVKDCTEDFYYHSRATRRIWGSLKVGELRAGESIEHYGVEVVRDAQTQQNDPLLTTSPVTHAYAMESCDVNDGHCYTRTVETNRNTPLGLTIECRCPSCMSYEPRRPFARRNPQ